MIILSNKPNVRGIKSTVKDIKYRTQLIGRDQRLFARSHSNKDIRYGYGIHTCNAPRRLTSSMGIDEGGVINGRRKKCYTSSYSP